MTIYLNCEKPEIPFGNIQCNKCGNRYKFEFDSIRAPYKETGILKCSCGTELIKWSSTSEPYLLKIENE